jgi:hypothetical protein
MACAIEDAGFEIRDCIMWIYGSGMPKSHDISKAIDKKLGAEREVIKTVKGMGKQNPEWNGTAKGRKENYYKPEYQLTASATPEAKQWEGWKSSLKPANEPIVLARKPISEKTIAENVLKWGTGGINIDDCRIPTDDNLNGGGYSENYKGSSFLAYGGKLDYKQPAGRFPANVILDEEAGRMLDEQSGITTNTRHMSYKRSGGEFINGIPSQPEKGWFKKETGGASRFFKNIDYTREESDWLKSQSFAFNVGKSLETMLVIIESFAPESVMQNLKKLLETSVDDAENQLKTTDIDIALRDVVILPNQEDKALNDIILHFMSEMLKALKKKDDANMRQIQNIVSKLEPELRHTLMEKLKCNPVNYADVSLLTNIMMIIQSLLTTDGCAEGVMLTTIKNNMVAGGEDYEEPTRFKYCAKASKKERGEGNNHPTVKPVKLIEYLITLVTPPNGTVLDPFFGSGTTGIAAVNLGFNYIGIELDEQYIEIAQRRIGGAE